MKKIIAFMLLIAMTMSLYACSAEPSEDVVGETEGNISVTDHRGKVVEFETTPQRIISGYYIASSCLIGLGLEDSFVGVENKADQRNIYSLAAPEISSLPMLGTMKEFDIEGAITQEPDLVILPLRLQDAAEALETVGIKTICINPENEQLLNEAIMMMATATGTVDRATAMIDKGSEELEALEVTLEGLESPTVYLAGNSDFLSTAGANMFQNTLIRSSNAVNVAEGIEDSYWAIISYEQLINYNPDYIIIAPEAVYDVEQILEDQYLQELDAVKNSQVYKMPSTTEAWDSPLPSSYLGSLWLASVIHPDAYTYSDFEEEASEFYSEFYGFEPTLK